MDDSTIMAFAQQESLEKTQFNSMLVVTFLAISVEI
jgi:hypothetical protein